MARQEDMPFADGVLFVGRKLLFLNGVLWWCLAVAVLRDVGEKNGVIYFLASFFSGLGSFVLWALCLKIGAIHNSLTRLEGVHLRDRVRDSTTIEVVVRFKIDAMESDFQFALSELEDELTKAVETLPGGKFLDFEVDGESGIIRLCGPDTDSVFEAIKLILEKSEIVGKVIDVREH